MGTICLHRRFTTVTKPQLKSGVWAECLFSQVQNTAEASVLSTPSNALGTFHSRTHQRFGETEQSQNHRYPNFWRDRNDGFTNGFAVCKFWKEFVKFNFVLNILSFALVTLLESFKAQSSESGLNAVEGHVDPESNVYLNPVRQNSGQIITEERSNKQRETESELISNLDSSFQTNDPARLNKQCVFMHIWYSSLRVTGEVVHVLPQEFQASEKEQRNDVIRSRLCWLGLQLCWGNPPGLPWYNLETTTTQL